jgi:DnaK suppressor protein
VGVRLFLLNNMAYAQTVNKKTATKRPTKAALPTPRPVERADTESADLNAPDPHADLEGWAKVVLSDMRNQALRAILRLKEESQIDMASAGGTSGDEADMSAAREVKQSRILSLSALQDRLSEIDAAIGRLERGEYGICEETGDEIPVERLRANPLSRMTIEAQERREHSRRLFARPAYQI